VERVRGTVNGRLQEVNCIIKHSKTHKNEAIATRTISFAGVLNLTTFFWMMTQINVGKKIQIIFTGTPPHNNITTIEEKYTVLVMISSQRCPRSAA